MGTALITAAVNTGSFYDWLGEAVPVFPDWGFRFEVLPDGKTGEVRRLRQARQAAKEAMQHAPLDLGLDLVSHKLGVQRKGSAEGTKMAKALSTHLREGTTLRWRELRSIELVLEELAGEFDGEAPARPQDRRAITEGKERLRELHEGVQDYVDPFDLPGPDEDGVERLREAIRRAAEG